MLNVIGIGLDYDSIVSFQTRGDFNDRLKEMSGYVQSLHRIIYSPARLSLEKINITENIDINFSNSKNMVVFFHDAVKIFENISRDKKIDLITAEDPLMAGLVGLYLRKKFKIPLNVQTNDGRLNNPYWLKERKKNYLLNEIAKFVLKRADSVRVVSYEAKERMAQTGVDPKKIFIVPTFIFTDIFNNIDGTEIRSRYLGNKFKKIILFMGRLSREKDIPTIFSAMQIVQKKNPETLLLLAGEGPLSEYLKEKVNAMNIINNVELAGSITYNDVPKYFNACDLVVLSSLHEGKPRVLVEAGLAKKAIVATNAGDSNKCLIEGKSGYIVPIGDYSLMAQRLISLLNDDEKLKRFGQVGFEYTKAIVAKEHNMTILIDCWKETIKSRKSKEV